MIIEQELEKRILNAIQDKLTENNITGIQLSGSLQTEENNIKAKENGSSTGYLIVKVNPRQYSSPTIPECEIPISVALTVRSDIDFDGKTYMDVFGVLISIFEQWQKCLSDVHTLFTIEDNFNVTGYQLNAGNCPLDANSKVWGYTHDMTIFGVIL